MHVDESSLRVLWTTLQIVQSVPWTLNVVFPEPFGGFLGALSLFALDFLSLDCAVSAPAARLSLVFAWAAAPLAVAAALGLAYAARARASPSPDRTQARTPTGARAHTQMPCEPLNRRIVLA